MNVLLLGSGAREHAIGAALVRSPGTRLFVLSSSHNPGLERLATAGGFLPADETEPAAVVREALARHIELAVVGPESTLEAGVPDALTAVGIPTVGPKRDAARLETSKLFTRDLMLRHQIGGRAEYRHFSDPAAMEAFLRASDREYALKPVGLTGGKGVQVMGLQLHSVSDAVAYGSEILQQQIGGAGGIVVEERLIGEEFTLQAFVAGDTLRPMPLVQDFKRAYEGDVGPNTGSMGSYSMPDGLLPFITAAGRAEALEVMRRLVSALRAEGVQYSGIMYGQFMLTATGPRLVEINARFGDPEAINVLALLRSDFVEICLAITRGTLSEVPVEFAHEATVCKYLTPPGYPEQSRSGVPLRLDLDAISRLGVEVRYAKVDGSESEVRTTNSRSIALVSRAATVEKAEAAVEQALGHVQGEFHVRHDIGRPELIYRSGR